MPIAATKNENLSLREYLVERRKFMKISSGDISSRTGIPGKYVKKIEAGEWFGLPPGVYAKGFIKKYALAVGLDENEAAQRYDLEVKKMKEEKTLPSFAVVSVKHSGRKFFAIRFFKNTSFRMVLFLFAAIFVFSYIAWQFSVVFKKPDLSVVNPAEDIVVSEPIFFVEGGVSVGDVLTINNESVYPEVYGSFKKEINLLEGMNVLEIKAVSRFGKESKIIRRVTYQQ